ncbi:ATP-binding protein [Streptomyces sp. SID4919]|uniref:ATP-binding protein n=1 Tax=unclassified Streptomyces TaxID=2593676 RepID=UPI000823F646|nr:MULTISPECIES: ATP-binding protein [unclassified Streptomyces]MYY10212.1 ATP-binding protein [Streptomyces sp. SID4919]SCK51516.1 Anti-sigma regulatory factor (Ser/Thr protein kinase) [Streptomyces sp. AmelKG-E11A]
MSATATTWAQRFSATKRGARLARRRALIELAERGFPLGGYESERVALIVAELASNAVTHGRVAGHDFELRVMDLEEVLRVEVSDARADRRPRRQPAHVGEGGYGMCLVEATATSWGVCDRVMGKTVWAEVAKRKEAGA